MQSTKTLFAFPPGGQFYEAKQPQVVNLKKECSIHPKVWYPEKS